MLTASGPKWGRPYSDTARPKTGHGKPLYKRVLRGLIVNTPAPLFPHIFPLLAAVGFLCTGRRAVRLPPIRGNGPSADRADLKIRPGPLGQESRLQRRIKGQDGLPEIAAISARPAFPQHIALTIQRQAPALPVIVGAPLYHKRADGRFFFPGKFAGHRLTSRQPGLSKVPGSRTHSRCPASRDTRSTGSPWAASAWPEPGGGASASSFFQRGCW